jgi:hypothetical protein
VKRVLLIVIVFFLFIVSVNAESPKFYTKINTTYVNINQLDIWEYVDSLEFDAEKDSNISVELTVNIGVVNGLFHKLLLDGNQIGIDAFSGGSFDSTIHLHTISNVTAGKHLLELWHKSNSISGTKTGPRELTVIVYPESENVVNTSTTAIGIPTPHLLSLQGYVTDINDIPISSGDLYITIYNSTQDIVWESEFIGAIDKGIFDLLLGGATPLYLDNTQLHYIDIEVKETGDFQKVVDKQAFYPGGGQHLPQVEYKQSKILNYTNTTQVQGNNNWVDIDTVSVYVDYSSLIDILLRVQANAVAQYDCVNYRLKIDEITSPTGQNCNKGLVEVEVTYRDIILAGNHTITVQHNLNPQDKTLDRELFAKIDPL